MKKVFVILGAVLLVIGLLMLLSETASVGIIGGADGPTAVFTAVNFAGGAWVIPVIAGVLLIVVSCVFLLKKKK